MWGSFTPTAAFPPECFSLRRAGVHLDQTKYHVSRGVFFRDAFPSPIHSSCAPHTCFGEPTAATDPCTYRKLSKARYTAHDEVMFTFLLLFALNFIVFSTRNIILLQYVF